MPPLVTVVTPVHNCMPYLEDTLASVYHQSLDRSAVEMVVVDDGSTDGSSECLRRWAEEWPQLRVITEAASGSASRPRNVGIEHATGEYLFFLDGDDCLGPQALERLLSMAKRNDSDVVLAKLVGVQRRVPAHVFSKDVDDADLTSGIYYSLMPFKLVRRSLVIDHDLRFPEHMRISEDQPFVAGCYLAAKRISVLGSYSCYYLVRRRVGSNTSFEGLDYPTIVAQAAECVELVRARTDPGRVRDHLVARHVNVELLRRFNETFLARTEEEQLDLVAVAQPPARDWGTPSVLAQLPVVDRVRVAAILDGDLGRLRETVSWVADGGRARVVREGDRWFLTGPGFRAEGSPRPDETYEMYDAPPLVSGLEQVTVEGGRLRLLGHALLRDVESAEVTVSLLARHPRSGAVREAVMAARPTPYLSVLEAHGVVDHRAAGFTAELDLEGARAGQWELSVRVDTGSYRHEQRLRGPSRLEADPDPGGIRPRVRAGKLVVEVPKADARPDRSPETGRWKGLFSRG